MQMYFLRWLVLKHRDREASLILNKINSSSNGEDSAEELEKLIVARGVNDTVKKLQVWKELLKWKIAKRMSIALTLFLLGPYLGNIVYYYTATIFCNLNIDPFIGSTIVGISVSCGSIGSLFLIDSFGRKNLLLSGGFLVGVASLLAGVLIQLFNSDESPKVVGYILIAMICFIAVCHAASWLVVPWVLNSEVFPLHIRGLSVGLSATVFWINSFVSSQVAPIIWGSSLQIHGYFYIVSGLCFFYFVFTLLTLPETKGIGLEDMDSLFSRDWKKNIIPHLNWSGCRMCVQSKPKPTVSATNPQELTSELN